MTTFGDRVYELGGAPLGQPLTGKIYWVDSNAADGMDSVGNGYGVSPRKPFLTLDYAIGCCTASKGDRIYLLPGHAENLTVGDLGQLRRGRRDDRGAGRRQPDADVQRDRAGRLDHGGGGQRHAAQHPPGGECDRRRDRGPHDRGRGRRLHAGRGAVPGHGTTKEYLVHVSVATTVTDLRIANCSFVGLVGGSMTNSILFAGTSADCVIEDSYIFVDSADDVIDHLAGASVNLVVRRNVVINGDTGAAGYCLRYKSDGTGVAYDNRFAYNKVDAEISVGAAAWWFDNQGQQHDRGVGPARPGDRARDSMMRVTIED